MIDLSIWNGLSLIDWCVSVCVCLCVYENGEIIRPIGAIGPMNQHRSIIAVRTIESSSIDTWTARVTHTHTCTHTLVDHPINDNWNRIKRLLGLKMLKNDQISPPECWTNPEGSLENLPATFHYANAAMNHGIKSRIWSPKSLWNPLPNWRLSNQVKWSDWKKSNADSIWITNSSYYHGHYWCFPPSTAAIYMKYLKAIG